MSSSDDSQKLGNEAHQLIRDVCAVAWTRLPGSKGEHDAQAYLHKQLKTYGADEVVVRHYTVHSKFFLWWPRLSIIFFVVSLIGYITLPILAFAFAILAIGNILLKFFSYSFFDVFFPKKPSCNVVAKLKAKQVGASGKPKRVILLGGHTDSNYEYPIGRKFGMGMIKVVIPVFVVMIVWVLGTLTRFILAAVAGVWVVDFTAPAFNVFAVPDWFLIVILCTIPYVGWVGLWMVSSRPVPGANDNLSGVSAAVETLKHFAQHPAERPQNVELWAVCFGSEEGGMMGSKNMARDVRGQLDSNTFSAESLWVVNFDGVGADGPLHIATKEPMYRVHAYDPAVYNALADSAKKANIEHYTKSLSAGGTDSAPFARLGISASAILCFGRGTTPPNWHCREDTPDNIDPRGLANSIKLAIQFVKDVDESLSSKK